MKRLHKTLRQKDRQDVLYAMVFYFFYVDIEELGQLHSKDIAIAILPYLKQVSNVWQDMKPEDCLLDNRATETLCQTIHSNLKPIARLWVEKGQYIQNNE